jgi:hypothetical protein
LMLLQKLNILKPINVYKAAAFIINN